MPSASASSSRSCPRCSREVTHAEDVAPYIGVMTALYAAMQFVFAPVLGALSDRLGRRPVLLDFARRRRHQLPLPGLCPQPLAALPRPRHRRPDQRQHLGGDRLHHRHLRRGSARPPLRPAQRHVRHRLHHRPGARRRARRRLAAAAVHRRGGAERLQPRARLLRPAGVAHAQPGADRPRRAQPAPAAAPGSFRCSALLPIVAIFFIFSATGEAYGTAWALWGSDTFQWNGLWIGLSLGAFGVCQTLVPGLPSRPGREAPRRARRHPDRHRRRLRRARRRWPSPPGAGWSSPSCRSSPSAASACRRCSPWPPGRSTRTARASSRACWPRPSASPRSSRRWPSRRLYFVVREQWPGAIWLSVVAVYALSLPLVLALPLGRPAAALKV